jgi:ParB family chromosome partitioning protein
MNTQPIPPGLLRPDPRNPRKDFCKVALQALADNILSMGQQVPLIVTPLGEDMFQIVDGHRRYFAAMLAGIPELACVVMLQNYSEADLRLTQMSIEAHKVALTIMERSELLARIKQETKWSVTELAKAVGIDQATCTKLLCLQRLDQDLKSLVHTGGLDLERAYIISSEPDVEKQRELAHAAPSLSRDQLRQRSKQSSAQAAAVSKTEKAEFVLKSGRRITLHGQELSIPSILESIAELGRELKRALADNLNLSTAQQVSRDRARVLPAS